MRYSFIPAILPGLCLLLSYIPCYSQKEVRGLVADSATRQPLPFATVRVEGQSKAVITGINGSFTVSVPADKKRLQISYVSYIDRTFDITHFKNNDTLFLVPAGATLGEVVVRSQDDKIRAIVNRAVRNKPLHNPELYELYECNVYYKMKVDMTMVPGSDTLKRRPQEIKNPRTDSAKKRTTTDSFPNPFNGGTHVLFSETYSKRLYKRPQQLQETILASRFSGLKKTYFTNLVTEVLPFHVYSDYILLNGTEYNNPVAKGWQQRYKFRLYDEIIDGEDTTFVLSFAPKEKVSFKSLNGLVYINSDGYAISHFIASTGDSASQREIRIEQIYTKKSGKWFPRELNYDLVFKKYPSPELSMRMNGHSIIDSVLYVPSGKIRIDKAYPVKFHDSIDLRTETQWQQMRMDSLTVREATTYHIMDSLFEKHKIEKIVYGIGKLGLGRLPIGIFDVDMTRLISNNLYENIRLGAGLYTNDKLSKYYSIGGWAGYGFKDKVVKYGGSFTYYPHGNKDNWARLFFEEDYQNAGDVNIHPEIDRTGFRYWILQQVDKMRQYGVMAHRQMGYWGVDVQASSQTLTSIVGNTFQLGGKSVGRFDINEAGIGLRYAYGEKRVPVFGYYFPSSTRYPIVYFKGSFGKIKADNYSADYFRALAAVTFNKRINRWGLDRYHLEAGWTHTFDNKPLSRSFLLASKGFRSDDGLNFYAWGGFLTMRPYDFYSDGYVSFLYKHDFDKHLWKTKFSKPFVSIAHNLIYGRLESATREANQGIAAPVSGYHESGLVLNQLLQMNLFNAFYLYINGGAFYHWTPSFNWKRNGIYVIGLSAGF